MVSSDKLVDISFDSIDHLGDDVDDGADVEADPGDPVEDEDGAQHHVVVPVHVRHRVQCVHHTGASHHTKYGNIVPAATEPQIFINNVNREICR